MRLCPKFELVVIAEVDFARAIRLGRTLGVIGPARESLLRRAPIAAAGIVDEGIARQRRYRGPELQAPYFGARGPLLGATGNPAQKDECSSENDRAHGPEDGGHPFACPPSAPTISPARTQTPTSRSRGCRAPRRS